MDDTIPPSTTTASGPNFRRLRLLLARSGLNVEFVDDGYRLTALNSLFIEPLE